MNETRLRSAMKALTWRFIATGGTVGITFAVTGSAEVAGSVGALEFILKLVLSYLHERAWMLTQWGTANIHD